MSESHTAQKRPVQIAYSDPPRQDLRTHFGPVQMPPSYPPRQNLREMSENPPDQCKCPVRPTPTGFAGGGGGGGGWLCKSGGAGKPVVRKNFFRTTGSMYKSKSGFDLYIDPVARKNFFRATGSMYKSKKRPSANCLLGPTPPGFAGIGVQ